MSWEALRLTSRTPAEIYHTIGPNGVDHLIRQAMSACWDAIPGESRTLKSWGELARQVFDRNMAVWARIRQPSPANFFQDLRPDAADGFMRQAMVLCYMMLPRGHKSADAVSQVVGRIFQRNMEAWEEDNQTMTKGPAKRPRKVKAPKPQKKAKKPK